MNHFVLCSVPWIEKNMTWHLTRRMPPGKMGHPVDSNAWKHIDDMYKDFSKEPRNVRLVLAMMDLILLDHIALLTMFGLLCV